MHEATRLGPTWLSASLCETWRRGCGWLCAPTKLQTFEKPQDWISQENKRLTIGDCTLSMALFQDTSEVCFCSIRLETMGLSQAELCIQPKSALSVKAGSNDVVSSTQREGQTASILTCTGLSTVQGSEDIADILSCTSKCSQCFTTICSTKPCYTVIVLQVENTGRNFARFIASG